MCYYRRCRSLKSRTKNDVEKPHFKCGHTCNSNEIIVIGTYREHDILSVMRAVIDFCEKTKFLLPPRSEIIIY